MRGTPITEAANGYGLRVTKGAVGLPVVYEMIGVAAPFTPATFSSTALDAVTANFGASAFAGAVPAGFTAGWPA